MKLRIVAIMTASVMVLLALSAFWNSDERQIKALFDKVSSEMEKNGPEPPFAQLAKARNLAATVAPRLRIEGFGNARDLTIDATDLTERIVILRREMQTFCIYFDQMTVKCPGGGTAQAFCNASCSGLPDWISETESFALTATLEKDPQSGRWRFTALHAASLVPQ